MSVKFADQHNVDEHLVQHNQVAETKSDVPTGDDRKFDYQRSLSYDKLGKISKISKDYLEDGSKMKLSLNELEDIDWDIILDEMHNKEDPLQELKLEWRDHSHESVKPGFIELAKTIGAHTTLIKLDCHISSVLHDTKAVVLLKELKNNRSIQHLRLTSDGFDSKTAHAFGQMLTNNENLRSLDISVTPSPEYNHVEAGPIDVEAVIELANSLQTTVIERLEINKFDNQGFKILAKSLPKTLVYLDLSCNEINHDSIPILHSYLKSNGSTLKSLVLDEKLTIQYLQDPESLSLSTVKIINTSSWHARSVRTEEPFFIQLSHMNDNAWSELFSELSKDDTIYREIHLIFDRKVDPNQLNYVKTLLSNQFRLTNLTVTGELVDASIQLELLLQLKENNSITELELCLKMDSNVFNELVNLLANKNNIIRLNLSNNSNINDEEAITLAQSLKNNTVLRWFTLNDSQVGDIGFQAILSALPTSLYQLTLKNSLIGAKSLPSLLDFIKTHPILKNISLETNGISNSSIEVDVPDLTEKIFEAAYENSCTCDLDINNSVEEAMARSKDDVIDLGCAALRDDHVLELCNELKKQPDRNLSLDLRYNERISPIGYRYLADILSSTINIVELSVENNNMNEEARTTLLSVLCNKKTLKKFDIRNNKLNNQDMVYIGCFIQNNPVLKEIDLQQCGIDANGAIHLAKALPESSLEILNLNQNSVGDDGCTSLLSSIPPTLTDLSFHGNQITESSLQTIIAFLTANQTLKKLGIGNNPVFGNARWNTYMNSFWQQASQASKINKICEFY